MARLPKIPLSKTENLSKAIEMIPSAPGAYSVEQDGSYLNWEELKYRKPPGNVSPEQWWQLVKLARLSSKRLIPGFTGNKLPFTFGMTDGIQRMVHEIDRDASGKIELPEDVTNKSTRDRYVMSSLIEEAFRSSQLEGASTTRAVAKEMIRAQREPRTHSERMIMNNYFAMEWVREHHKDALTPEMLFELHTIVTKDTLEIADGGGRFRRNEENIQVVDRAGDVVHLPPDANLLPQRFRDLCAFANGLTNEKQFIHPVVRSILLHLWLAYDHPFVDGNGRTARALFYWSMLKQGYWLAEFISISKAITKSRNKYDKAFLYTESDDNDATYFLLNQFDMLRTAVDELFNYLKRKATELRDIETRLRNRDDLNNRQLAVLSYAASHPDGRITIESHQNSHRVVYQTARTDLLGLAKHGFLVQRKTGKKLVFEPARDLQKKLKPE
jgi:Fic family protein